MPRPSVFVTRALPGDPLPPLRAIADVDVWPDEAPPPHDELVRRAAACDALLTMLTDPIDAAVLDAGKRLRIVATMAVGYDNIDVAAATERGILVTNTPGVLTETTADLTFALLLAAARRIVEGDRLTRTGGWRSWHPSFLLGHDVYGATLGIVGLGQIGLAVARRARGFGMRILYHSRTRHPQAEAELGLEFVPLDRLLAESDFVTPARLPVAADAPPHRRARAGADEADGDPRQRGARPGGRPAGALRGAEAASHHGGGPRRGGGGADPAG